MNETTPDTPKNEPGRLYVALAAQGHRVDALLVWADSAADAGRRVNEGLGRRLGGYDRVSVEAADDATMRDLHYNLTRWMAARAEAGRE